MHRLNSKYKTTKVIFWILFRGTATEHSCQLRAVRTSKSWRCTKPHADTSRSEPAKDDGGGSGTRLHTFSFCSPSAVIVSWNHRRAAALSASGIASNAIVPA